MKTANVRVLAVDQKVALNLSLIVFLAFFTASSSVSSAQSSGHPSLSTQIYTPRSAGAEYPLQTKDAIKEEDLQERPPTVPSWVSSPEPGRFTVIPGIQEQTVPATEVGVTEPDVPLESKDAAISIGKTEQEAMADPADQSPSPSAVQFSLIAKITPETAPRRAASLRLTEEGRLLINSGEYEKALNRFEKTIAIDSTNPYSYYYLALAHHHLTHYQQSTNFLDVAESLLSEEPHWLARVFTLKGKNLEALGSLEQADASYTQALQIDPNNQAAFEGMIEINFEK